MFLFFPAHTRYWVNSHPPACSCCVHGQCFISTAPLPHFAGVVVSGRPSLRYYIGVHMCRVCRCGTRRVLDFFCCTHTHTHMCHAPRTQMRQPYFTPSTHALTDCYASRDVALLFPNVSRKRRGKRCNSPSPRGAKGKYMVMGVLSTALDLAKAAVAHDEQGALPEKVLPYYKKVRKKKNVGRRERTDKNINISRM